MNGRVTWKGKNVVFYASFLLFSEGLRAPATSPMPAWHTSSYQSNACMAHMAHAYMKKGTIKTPIYHGLLFKDYTSLASFMVGRGIGSYNLWGYTYWVFFDDALLYWSLLCMMLCKPSLVNFSMNEFNPLFILEAILCTCIYVYIYVCMCVVCACICVIMQDGVYILVLKIGSAMQL